ncbi:MAG: hypothetical protein ACQGVK_01725 [Myxococcota bacterium]
MKAALSAGRALLSASEALEAALARGRAEDLGPAFAAREAAFAAFAKACGRLEGDPPAAVRELAERVLAIDARVIAHARGALGELRGELHGLGARRRAREASRAAASAPRFLSRRV